jgi:hypothetical protein
MSHFLFEMWLNITTRKQHQTEGNKMLTEKMQTIKNLAEAKGYRTLVRKLEDRTFLNVFMANGLGIAVEANFENGGVRHIVEREIHGFGSRVSMKSIMEFLTA